jgi:uncharacterized membrane protein YhhN
MILPYKTLLWTTFVIATLDWLAAAKKWKPLRYISKPGTMIVLIAWLWLASGFQGRLIWFAIALFLSLIGDIFLISPQTQFIPGLISFLIAHLAYIIGLNDTLPPINLASLAVGIMVIFVNIQLYRRLADGMAKKGTTNLAKPVLFYTIIISLMLISALLTLVRPDRDWKNIHALLVSFGALSFTISDTLIAWDRFVYSLPNRDLIVMATYHLGQIGLTVGAALHFLGFE